MSNEPQKGEINRMSISVIATRRCMQHPSGSARRSITSVTAVASLGAVFATAGLLPTAGAQVPLERAISEEQVGVGHAVPLI
jgi:hypothetical protein